MSDLVSDLQDVAEGRLDLASIVSGASDSLKLIEPWREASVDNDALMKIVQDIQQNGLTYYDAIDMSIKTAEDGHAFSSDIIDLCDFLLEPTTDLDDILEYVETIRKKASTAHTESEATKEKFRAVRAGLNKITQRIPVEVEKLEKSEDAQKKGIMFKLNPFTKKTDTAELKKREVECATAIAELQRAALDLEKLSESVNEFARWWVVTETLLKTERGRGESLNPTKVQKLVVKSTQKGWRKIQADYLEYKVNIVKLQDYYPSAAQRKLNSE
jgi:hypothetical protein